VIGALEDIRRSPAKLRGCEARGTARIGGDRIAAHDLALVLRLVAKIRRISTRSNLKMKQGNPV
jgi:hypothetical protein